MWCWVVLVYIEIVGWVELFGCVVEWIVVYEEDGVVGYFFGIFYYCFVIFVCGGYGYCGYFVWVVIDIGYVGFEILGGFWEGCGGDDGECCWCD